MFNLQENEYILGLGSNENALSMLRAARRELKFEFIVLKSSSIYFSEALLPPGAPLSWNKPYLNAAIKIKTEKKPLEVLKIVKQVEKKLGRAIDGGIDNLKKRWAPRCIDIDLLAYGRESIEIENESGEFELVIPHSGLLKRAFAFLPAQECASLSSDKSNLKFDRLFEDEISNRTTKRAAVYWPEIVSILNLTPDSFSDGGQFFFDSGNLGEKKIIEMIDARVSSDRSFGVTHFDLGAESTRPGATSISSEIEKQRLRPAFDFISKFNLVLSLDSRNPKTIESFIDQIAVVNDVSGMRDPEMVMLAKRYKDKQIILMHSLSVPADPNIVLETSAYQPEKTIQDVKEFAKTKRQYLADQGIDPVRLVFDPGLGFGKTREQNFDLARSFYGDLMMPLYMGHSRKRFLAPELEAIDRDLETSLLSFQLKEADYLRVHSVEHAARSLTLANLMGV